jgi:hypothetical protein
VPSKSKHKKRLQAGYEKTSCWSEPGNLDLVFIDNPYDGSSGGTHPAFLAPRDRKSGSPSEFCKRVNMKAFLRLITLTSALALWLVFPGFAAEP